MTNDAINHYYLQQMGIQVWTTRQTLTCDNRLSQLERDVSHCVKCSLHKSRTNTVFARGNSNASLMIVGEAPGFYEDQQGLPFVGKAGGLLNQMLHSIDFSDKDVYIANVLKCRPPDNRNPNDDEILQCGTYLSQQIELIAPKLLLALGCFAGQFLVKKTLPLYQLRTTLHHYNDIPCLVTYHPAYLLRKPADKKKAYCDLLRVKQLLQTV